MNRPMIVAEITKNWTGTEKPSRLISQEFELVIENNRKRGYRLASWRMTMVGTPSGLVMPARSMVEETSITETIVAVFERDVKPGE